jgi:hypothetical protein
MHHCLSRFDADPMDESPVYFSHLPLRAGDILYGVDCVSVNK